MLNHIHIVAVPEHKGGLAQIFRIAHLQYSRMINFREGWRGHLWQERFHSFVMDEHYLMATVRYVELNPVRAALCMSRRTGVGPVYRHICSAGTMLSSRSNPCCEGSEIGRDTCRTRMKPDPGTEFVCTDAQADPPAQIPFLSELNPLPVSG